MEAILTRVESTVQGTFGEFKIEELGFSCLSLELPWKDNKKQISCIPLGSYPCKLTNSPKFGIVYAVKKVFQRSNILIHWGNYAGDAALGYKTDSNGCILLGKKRGILLDQKAVLASVVTLKALLKATKGESFNLTIIDLE